VPADNRIGYLFPAGGPVPRELMIGREAALDELNRRISEGMHTMLTGERRIGKTTVCDAACDLLSEAGSVVIRIEAPEDVDATALLQLVVDRTRRRDPAAVGRRLFKAAEPLVEGLLREQGIPLDLSQLDRGSPPDAARKILALPLRIAEEEGRRVVFYFDELQRVVDYEGGERLLGDLVDLYSGQAGVVLLVDGSSERALDRMMGRPVGFGKLVGRLALAEEIPAWAWRAQLPERFGEAGLRIEPEALEELVSFGAGRPYTTMAAARYSALNARKLGSPTVGTFEVREGIEEARRHISEDRP
jgi:energy-coupling factor transporter ATP-binding protein EcfA2